MSADYVNEPEEEWATLEVAFTSTPEASEDKFQMISMTLSEVLKDATWHRPTYRSRIAWDNGTLDYTYEVSVKGLDQDKAVEALLHHGLIDNPAALVVA